MGIPAYACPERSALRAPQGFAPAGTPSGEILLKYRRRQKGRKPRQRHRREEREIKSETYGGPNESIKVGQIRLTKTRVDLAPKARGTCGGGAVNPEGVEAEAEAPQSIRSPGTEGPEEVPAESAERIIGSGQQGVTA